MTELNRNDFRDYEIVVQRVIESLIGVDVFHSKEYEGRITGRKIKIDVSFLLNIAGADLLVLVECKSYKHRVSVDDVEEFHSKIDDIGAQKGILITTIGFQKGAVNAARGRRIALATLTRDSQPGEICYVVNRAGPLFEGCRPVSTEFFQGNVKGLVSESGGGLRFESFSQLVGMLIVDSHHAKD